MHVASRDKIAPAPAFRFHAAGIIGRVKSFSWRNELCQLVWSGDDSTPLNDTRLDFRWVTGLEDLLKDGVYFC